MALGGLAFVLGSALQAAAPEIVQLVIGRILLGIGIGFANQVAAAFLHFRNPLLDIILCGFTMCCLKCPDLLMVLCSRHHRPILILTVNSCSMCRPALCISQRWRQAI